MYQQKSVAHLQAYYHTLLEAQVATALIQAINNNLVTLFLELTVDSIQKHLPKTLQKTKGYLHKAKKIRSAAKVTVDELMEKTNNNVPEDYLPQRQIKNPFVEECFVYLFCY